MKSFSIFIVLLGLILCCLVPCNETLAGSIEGTGVVKYKKTEINLLKILKRRHELGMDYALTNRKFKSLVENFALSVAISAGLGSAPADAKAIASEIIAAIKAVAKVENRKMEDLDGEFALTAIETVSTAVVTGYCPSCGVYVGVGKIAASFASAYTYGFFFGI